MSKKDVSVNVQINDLNGIANLIKNDPDLEIKIKNSVINGFCKNYLKGIFDDNIKTKLMYGITEELKNNDYFGLLVKDGNPWSNRMVLSNNTKDRIRNFINIEAEEVINKYIKEKISEIQTNLDETINYFINTKIGEIIDKKIDNVIKEKLASALNNFKNTFTN